MDVPLNVTSSSEEDNELKNSSIAPNLIVFETPVNSNLELDRSKSLPSNDVVTRTKTDLRTSQVELAYSRDGQTQGRETTVPLQNQSYTWGQTWKAHSYRVKVIHLSQTYILLMISICQLPLEKVPETVPSSLCTQCLRMCPIKIFPLLFLHSPHKCQVWIFQRIYRRL